MGGSSTKSKKNLMKYNLQKSNIHDWIESKLNLEA
jgi:hypothetical protein